MKFDEFIEKSLLMGLHRRYQQSFEPLMANIRQLNLNLNDSLVLLALFFEGKQTVTPSDLIRTLRIPKDQVSQSLKRLEAKDLLYRQISENDQRRRAIHITSLGKKISAQLVAKFDKQENLLEQLGEHQ
jgi:DNA-binding MarR family transcriptional regulator